MEEGKMGWICPICKNGVAPAEKLCPHCIPVEKIKSTYPGLKEEHGGYRDLIRVAGGGHWETLDGEKWTWHPDDNSAVRYPSLELCPDGSWKG